MIAPLYRWPAAAKFGRVVPKTKFYENAMISFAVRDKFVSEIQRITWAYKLSDETIHLRGDVLVPEIQIFAIDAKDDDVSDAVLAAIDKAIPFPIVFEISRGSGDQIRTRMTAAYKQIAGMQRLGVYFTTDWQGAEATRAPLPPSRDLSGLYIGLLTPILPIALRPGEDMSVAAGRIEQCRKLEREIAAMDKKLRAEPQFNRKVELRRQLRDRTAALSALTEPATPKTEESPWRS
ncbi:DUF4391 domain-containing protein [Cryobacterium sp. PH31-O1]|uniref:DUF4391 domain-containing protein n=1 Tax=Cryobacterium sp. PH31-O1 TaxID=3046306 RepID=UPI0024BBBC7C|nr:DUF4391 domain-containing protein [Cryobacterium sp. PH31-O1]MDJ0338699.1 DUF4391 domain-containing protein [Cryobacterium sp. PH31-O1]